MDRNLASMPNRTAFVVLFFIFPIWVFGQPIPESDARLWLKQLAVSHPDSGRVNDLLKLAAYYQLKEGEDRGDIDSAFLLSGQADSLARKIGYRPGSERAALRVCQIRVEINDSLGIEDVYPSLSDSNKVKLLLEWGSHYIFLTSSQHKKAIEGFCQESLKISAASGDARLLCLTNELWALSYLVFDNSLLGEHYARKCLAYLRSTGDTFSLNEFCYRLRLLELTHLHNGAAILELCKEYESTSAAQLTSRPNGQQGKPTKGGGKTLLTNILVIISLVIGGILLLTFGRHGYTRRLRHRQNEYDRTQGREHNRT